MCVVCGGGGGREGGQLLKERVRSKFCTLTMDRRVLVPMEANKVLEGVSFF